MMRLFSAFTMAGLAAVFFVGRKKGTEIFSNKIVIGVTVAGTFLGFIWSYFLRFECRHQMLCFQRISLSVLMWPIASIDHCFQKIPNSLIILGVVNRAVLWILEGSLEENILQQFMTSELSAVLFVFLLSVGCSVSGRDSIGMGDIKLLLLMGLFLGIDEFLYTLFTACIGTLMVYFFFSGVRRKIQKNGMPFAPSLMAGVLFGMIFRC